MSAQAIFDKLKPEVTIPPESPAPLHQLLPYLIQAASLATSAITVVSRVAISLTSRILHQVLLFSPLNIALYLLAPFIVFFEIVFGFLVVGPYHAVLYLLDAIYPVYVFVGVACITGGLMGLGGRWMTQGLVAMIVVPISKEVPENDKEIRVKFET